MVRAVLLPGLRSMNCVIKPTCFSHPKLLLLSKSTLHITTVKYTSTYSCPAVATTSYYKPPTSNASTTNDILVYNTTKHRQQDHLSYIVASEPQLSPSRKNKNIMMIDTSYIAVTLFTGLLGFLFLSILGRPRSRRDLSPVVGDSYQTRNDPTQADYPRDNGFDADVIIVGAGVAGAALAHTLAKVPTFYRFIWFFVNNSPN